MPAIARTATLTPHIEPSYPVPVIGSKWRYLKLSLARRQNHSLLRNPRSSRSIASEVKSLPAVDPEQSASRGIELIVRRRLVSLCWYKKTGLDGWLPHQGWFVLDPTDDRVFESQHQTETRSELVDRQPLAHCGVHSCRSARTKAKK